MPTFAEDMSRLKAEHGSVYARHMRAAGFVEVMATSVTEREWGQNHDYLRSVFGDRFTWCGSNWFFETEKDALIFQVFCT